MPAALSHKKPVLEVWGAQSVNLNYEAFLEPQTPQNTAAYIRRMRKVLELKGLRVSACANRDFVLLPRLFSCGKRAANLGV